MNPYIEILRPGNVIMAMIAIILVAIVSHTISIMIVLIIKSIQSISPKDQYPQVEYN